MRKELMFGLYLFGLVLTYLAGYYAELSKGWTHVLIIFTIIIHTIVLKYGGGNVE